MNFLLRHEPVLTYDVDVWVKPTAENLRRVEDALSVLGAYWGRTENEWGPVDALKPGWLGHQSVYCMTTALGALDVFLHLTGVEDWDLCRSHAAAGSTACGVDFWGLSDRDMLRCQEVLAASEQKLDRIRVLRNVLGEGTDER